MAYIETHMHVRYAHIAELAGYYHHWCVLAFLAYFAVIFHKIEGFQFEFRWTHTKLKPTQNEHLLRTSPSFEYS